MVGYRGSQIYLFRTGGTVDWSATVGNDPGHVIGVSPGSGTLTARGPIAIVTVTTSQFVQCGTVGYPTITINPGGAQYSVCTGWIKPFAGHGHGHGHAIP